MSKNIKELYALGRVAVNITQAHEFLTRVVSGTDIPTQVASQASVLTPPDEETSTQNGVS